MDTLFVSALHNATLYTSNFNRAYDTPVYRAKTKTGDLVSITHNDDGTYDIESTQTSKTVSADTFAEACSVFADWLDHYTVLVRGCAIDILAGAYTEDEATLVSRDRHGDLKFAIAKSHENKSFLQQNQMQLIHELKL